MGAIRAGAFGWTITVVAVPRTVQGAPRAARAKKATDIGALDYAIIRFDRTSQRDNTPGLKKSGVVRSEV